MPVKYLACLLTLLVWLTQPALAQLDTTGGKFYQPLYSDPAPSVSTGVAFGSYPTSQSSTQPLLMDVYQPIGGPNTPRPLIILAHGGAFVFGNRADYDVTELCRRFARLGYVTASIDYRLESPFTYSGARAVVQAMQDMRAAVRFFRQDAATTNSYNINPDYIFVGGSSAGALTALHVAYLDQQAELDALNAGVPGGLEGSGGNPGYSSAVRAVINLCGALGRSAWLGPGDEPLVSVHGTMDAVVPYGRGSTFTGDIVYGSGALHPRADSVGVLNRLRTFKGAGHVPYNGLSAAQLAYMDTTFRTVRDFLRPLLAQPAPLPVRLSSFTAVRQGGTVLLRWQSAQELNSAGYEVQVSAEGKQYVRLGFVPSSAATTSNSVSYEFRDADAAGPGLRYYRLRQLDLDGTAHYFGPRVVASVASAARLMAFPNPVNGTEAYAQVTVTAPTTARLELSNALGQLLYQQELTLPAGPTRISLPQFGTYPAGAYYLVLHSQGAAPQRLTLLRR
ncbi:alpha/beta hydrolase [Hymenobacter sp. CRA2]|uniref:alpha/beta hydrolase n=1 Tax=Hymenobacter sp. CRA2 TaxID=1955620 RepID=UPI00098F5587|nr:alpha/beta hydrolase [Hymenobacter sp. CRA2]OON66717.1 hypothetical protein B0919_21265 [Hymenobacter sp. CRA2]